MRRFTGLLLGFAVALALTAGADALAHALYPFFEDFETLDKAELAAVMAAVPFAAKAIIASGWFFGAFAGSWLALRVADRVWTGWVVTALVVLGGISNLIAIPHPLWMQVGAIALPIFGGWLAQRIHHKPYKGEPLLG